MIPYPPLLMRLRIRGKGKRGFSLWIPLLLIWPFFLFFGLLLTPFVLIAAFVFEIGNLGEIFKQVYLVVCATRGLTVNVLDSNAEVIVQFQ